MQPTAQNTHPDATPSSQVHYAEQLYPSRHNARLWVKDWLEVHCLQLQLQVR